MADKRYKPFRRVTFATTSASVAWALGGLALGAIGVALALPAFSKASDPPLPWGMWITTNGGQRSLGKDPSWMLNLTETASAGCSNPVTVRGVLVLGDNAAAKLQRQPTYLAIVASRAEILSAEFVNNKPKQWQPMRVRKFRKVYILTAKNDHLWARDFHQARFRFTANVAKPNGFAACYVTSPGLFEYPGLDRSWGFANGEGGVFFGNMRHRPSLDYAPLTDAIVTVRAPGYPPDRAALDAGATVVRDGAVIPCDGYVDNPPRGRQSDDFAYAMMLAKRSNCASVQSFKATDAANSLNRRVFLAGLLLSVAAAMILEALNSLTRPAREQKRSRKQSKQRHRGAA